MYDTLLVINLSKLIGLINVKWLILLWEMNQRANGEGGVPIFGGKSCSRNVKCKLCIDEIRGMLQTSLHVRFHDLMRTIPQ